MTDDKDNPNDKPISLNEERQRRADAEADTDEAVREKVWRLQAEKFKQNPRGSSARANALDFFMASAMAMTAPKVFAVMDEMMTPDEWLVESKMPTMQTDNKQVLIWAYLISDCWHKMAEGGWLAAELHSALSSPSDATALGAMTGLNRAIEKGTHVTATTALPLDSLERQISALVGRKALAAPARLCLETIRTHKEPNGPRLV